MTMSDWLTTPTGRPASSITGAALKPWSVRKAVASLTVALATIDSGFGVIRSAADSARSVSQAITLLLAGFFIVVPFFVQGGPNGLAPGTLPWPHFPQPCQRCKLIFI